MTWIDDEEKQYRERRKGKKLEEDLQCDRAEAIRAQARKLLDALVEVVESDVKNYNEGCKDDSERQVSFTRKPSGGFKLDRLLYPSAASVDCSLDTDNNQFRAEYSFRQDRASQRRQEQKSLQLDVDESGNAVIRTSSGVVSPDEASRLLIQHVLFGTK